MRGVMFSEDLMLNSFSRRFKDLRLDLQLTQPEFASAIGISVRTVIRIEQGAKPSDLVRVRIEKFRKSATKRAA